MLIQTTRFGSIQLNEFDLITFREGLLGFTELRKFVLLDDPGDEIFAWLQSCEQSAVAFPILEPELFYLSYKPTLTRNDLAATGLGESDRMKMFTIITIPDDATQMTANLKAPVVINVTTRQAKQIVVQDNDYQIKYPIFMELQKRVFQSPPGTIKHAENWEFAVRLPAQPVKCPEANF